MTVFSHETISRSSSAVTSMKTNASPHMRYSRDDILSSVILVKSKLFGFRRRYVRLEHGILSIFPETEDYDDPSRTIRVNEARSIDIDPVARLIHIRAVRRSTIWATLSFKKQSKDLFDTWAHVLKNAYTNVLEKHYQLRTEIDQGHTAAVFKAIDKKTRELVAVKAIIKDRTNPLLMKNIRREVEIVRHVSHPNIVKTYDVFETSKVLYIVMEYIPGGTLLSFLAGGKNRINERNGLRIARQLLEVVAYLHDENILHRDIKPENVLITSKGTLKLIDFGLSRFMRGAYGNDYNLSSIVGTPAYCPPEIVCKKQYGKPIDLYGCGALLYLALSGARPIAGETRSEVFNNIRKGVIQFPERRWSHVSEDARDLVRELLSFDANMRPTAREALLHPWIRMGMAMSRVRSALSASPFVRNESANGLKFRGSTNSGTASPRFSRTESGSTSPKFRRTESGSLAELSVERHKKNLALVAMLK